MDYGGESWAGEVFEVREAADTTAARGVEVRI
jgi:hypothetical protein